ncbi:unnamed protein product [Medioppia subpectinata]|uniref:Aminotransferase class I/classII large domain-containing protein n=1 Tax=Medioppia subpectinata TaxID=1979941 RepID=A0A7R9KJT6_9ACAR|nr:unnamed protein product [Medioppia subpectinata]CAG2103625.1 unnamed protein product [Medioppia subpectinata]
MKDDNILITLGAYQAIHCALYGLINHGDEVIIIDPAYDAYAMITRAAGGVPVHTALKRVDTCNYGNNNDITGADGWELDFADLEAKFNHNTRLIIINTPHNPLGKVFTASELSRIGELCQKYDTIAIMDEVYEWLTYDNNTHCRLASMPGMYERTVTIGSLGKAFNVTGWRCGWAITGHPGIRHALTLAHMASVYCCPTPIQEAAARAFEIELDKLQLNHVDSMYWTQLCALLDKKRALMYDMLTDMGLKPMVPEGGYYMVAECRALIDRLDLTAYYDKRGKTFEFVRWLSARGVQAVPLTVFYSTDNKHLAEGLVRFCFIKSDETLAKAEAVLRGITNELGANKGFYLSR